jgi:hypothetical protein
MALTTQQQGELLARVSRIVGYAMETHELRLKVQQQLFDFVDGIADARVVTFAQGALLASDVAKHLENTLEQYAQLGLSGVKS